MTMPIGRKTAPVITAPMIAGNTLTVDRALAASRDVPVDAVVRVAEAYLEDLLMKVATTPASEIASLTPWAWQAARASD